jgi:hypothetical protein
MEEDKPGLGLQGNLVVRGTVAEHRSNLADLKAQHSIHGLNSSLFSVSLSYYAPSVTMNVKHLDVHVNVHRDKFLIIKPTRCTNFSNLFLE